MTSLAHLTAGVIVADTALLIAYDIWVKVKQPDGKATLSWVMLKAATRVPLVACAWGILTGHFFFPNCP